jgi:hypothetical protein
MEQNLPVETFKSVREDNLFKQTVYSGKVPVGPSKYACSSSVWNHRNFHVNGKQPRTTRFSLRITFIRWIGTYPQDSDLSAFRTTGPRKFHKSLSNSFQRSGKGLFAPTASSPQLLCFLSPRGED